MDKLSAQEKEDCSKWVFFHRNGNFLCHCSSQWFSPVRPVKNIDSKTFDYQVSDIRRPKEYETVVREKESAKQNIKIARQERPRILTAAKTKLLEAKTQSNITLNIARTNARIRVKKAENEAKAILNAYVTEATTYKSVMEIDLSIY